MTVLAKVPDSINQSTPMSGDSINQSTPLNGESINQSTPWVHQSIPISRTVLTKVHDTINLSTSQY